MELPASIRIPGKILFLILFPLWCKGQAPEVKIKTGDFQKLTGKEWSGNIIVQMPGFPEPKIIPAKLKVTNPQENIYLFSSNFSDGIGAYSTDSVRIDKNGTKIGKETVQSRTTKSDTLVIVTEQFSNLDSLTVLHTRYTYKILPRYFQITCEEKQGEENNFGEVYRQVYKRD